MISSHSKSDILQEKALFFGTMSQKEIARKPMCFSPRLQKNIYCLNENQHCSASAFRKATFLKRKQCILWKSYKHLREKQTHNESNSQGLVSSSLWKVIENCLYLFSFLLFFYTFCQKHCFSPGILFFFWGLGLKNISFPYGISIFSWHWADKHWFSSRQTAFSEACGWQT